MKLWKKHNKLQYKISQIPTELQNYFYIRWIASAISLCTILITFLLVGMYEALGVISLGITAYAGYVTYNCFKVLAGKIIIIQGVCESRENEHFKVSNPFFKRTNFMNLFEYYGKSTATVVMEDMKFIVPVSHKLPAKENQVIRIYSFPEEIYQSTENSYRINNPLLVKVIKI